MRIKRSWLCACAFALMCLTVSPAAMAGGCEGDATGDGVTDLFDLLEVLTNWGECKGCDADLNDDGVVDFEDLLIVIGDYGCGAKSCESREDCDDGDDCTFDFCIFGSCFHFPDPRCS